MEQGDAEAIVNSYGESIIARYDAQGREPNIQRKALMVYVAPVSLLHHSVPEIKAAILLLLQFPQTDRLAPLVNTFVALAHYIPDTEYQSALASINQMGQRSVLADKTISDAEAREESFCQELEGYSATLQPEYRDLILQVLRLG